MREDDLFGVAVRGALHAQNGQERQDNAGTCFIAELSSGIAVVADGHGDSSCPRSAQGSALAIEAASEALSSFAHEIGDEPDAKRRITVARDKLGELTDGILQRWIHKVLTNYYDSSGEMPERSQASRGTTEEQHRITHLYGTTLVAILLTPEFCTVIQQGDGCCALILSDATILVNEQVVAPDERCVGNLTTSLSDQDAKSSIRASIFEIDEDKRRIAACFVGTDGVSSSIPGDGVASLAIALALGRVEARDGAAWDEELSAHLSDFSADGSGDDVSLAGFVDSELVTRIKDVLIERRDQSYQEIRLSALRDKLRSMQRKRDYYLHEMSSGQEANETRRRYLDEYDAVSSEAEQIERALVCREKRMGQQEEETIESEESTEGRLEATETSDDGIEHVSVRTQTNAASLGDESGVSIRSVSPSRLIIGALLVLLLVGAIVLTALHGSVIP